ncbi:ABC transporter permease [Gynuella sunshinyii]|uniref:ABC-type dipeptide/oligopeptide/nickel transport system, permease component n=1 Tax=Gynuella sunshinyii YC6258 TaxID=1445510 RepID=A0A0C5VT29_9GAMM|nr:ABC transporter permease [Gynuella sunshinyii]AJQ96488.1 ABC-type dipeptide/oligopeptide/nickel transport system, permease component [Gynuella sunshinyii YC6258]
MTRTMTLYSGKWHPRCLFDRLSRGLSGQTTLKIGLAIVLTWLLVALLAPWISPYDPMFQDLAARLAPVSLAHPLGTDNFGRDILARIIWGARVDLLICVLGVLFPFLAGTIIGALSGYAGGWLDAVVMRVIDVILAFPFLVLMLAIITIVGPGLTGFFIAMTLVGWVSYARLVRSRVLILKQSDFILAAQSLGFSRSRILFRHLLPNVIADALVFSMSDAVLVLLNGAAISYLGLGVQPPLAEWGVMVTEGQGFITTAWWITAFPGLAIVLLAMGFSFIADGLGEKHGTTRGG